MKVTKWIDLGSKEVEVQIGADDIRDALVDAFAVANQTPEQGVNVHDVVLALSSIGSFLRALTDDQIARLNEKQRSIVGKFLEEQAVRFK